MQGANPTGTSSSSESIRGISIEASSNTIIPIRPLILAAPMTTAPPTALATSSNESDPPPPMVEMAE